MMIVSVSVSVIVYKYSEDKMTVYTVKVLRLVINNWSFCHD